MKPNDLYARLELIEPAFSSPKAIRSAHRTGIRQQFQARLGPIGQALLNYFCGSLEPTIRTCRSTDGNPCYRVYDPSSQQRLTFGSEEELRIWLDQRYYQ